MAPSQAPLKTTFLAQRTIQPTFSGGPNSVAISADHSLLVTACEDEAVLMDMSSGAEFARIEGDGEDLTALALTPTASHLITCSRSYQMRIYDISSPESPELQRQTRVSAAVMVCVVDPTGTLVSTGGADGIVRVWDIAGGFVTHNLRGHGGLVSSLAFYIATGEGDVQVDTGKKKSKKKQVKGRFMLASGGDDASIRVWDLETGAQVGPLQGHTSVVRGLDWSVDGGRLVSGGRDGVLCLWDTTSWKYVITPAGEEVEAVGFVKPGVMVREDGGQVERLVFAAGRRDRVRVWDLEEGKELTEETGTEEVDEEKGISQIVYHKNQPALLSVHNDYTVQIHNLRLPSPAPTSLPVSKHLTLNYDEILDLRILPGSRIAMATNSSEVRIVDSTTFQDLHLLQGHTDTVLSVSTDWSGHYLATAGKDNTARLWRLSNPPVCEAVFTGHTESVAALSLPRSMPQESSKAYTERHPPQFLLTGSADRTIKKWTITPGGKKQRTEYTRRAHDKDINVIAVSPDDSTFASASQDRTIKIWNTASGETTGVLRGHRRGVWTIHFSASTSHPSLISGSTDKTVKLWNLSDFTCTRTFEGHSNSIQRVLFINNDTQLLSAANDGLLKVWDCRTAECSATLDNHTQRIWALDAAPSGAALISADAAGILTLWSDATEQTRIAADREDAARVEREQHLDNFISLGDYRRAVVLALALNHPARLLGILTAAGGDPAVDEVLAGLADSQLAVLLQRVRDWNTNVKTAGTAQKVLGVLVRAYEPDRLGRLKGCEGVWEVLRAYTERHYRRVEELVEESWVVEYLLREMDMVGVRG